MARAIETYRYSNPRVIGEITIPPDNVNHALSARSSQSYDIGAGALLYFSISEQVQEPAKAEHETPEAKMQLEVAAAAEAKVRREAEAKAAAEANAQRDAAASIGSGDDGGLRNDRLPPGWKEHCDPNGRPYYYKIGTKVSQWDRPVSASDSV